MYDDDELQTEFLGTRCSEDLMKELKTDTVLFEMMLSVNQSHPQSKITGQPEWFIFCGRLHFFMKLGQAIKYYDNKMMLTMFIERPRAK